MAERYSLAGPGGVEATDHKEYSIKTVEGVEASGWIALNKHYLLRYDQWVLHVMVDDWLTQEQLEILANKMNYFIVETMGE